MNQRIRQLAEQCRFEIQGINCEVLGQGLDEQKFAESIVRECMACSTWVGKMNTNSGEPIHTAHAINQRIKQLFGVEE